MNLKNFILHTFLFTTLLSGCGQTNNSSVALQATASNNEFVQTVELKINGKKITTTEDDNLSMSYVIQKHLGLSVMSEKKDFHFTFYAYLTALKAGVYQVYTCKLPSDCDQETNDKKQFASYGPFIRDVIKQFKQTRIAYDVPSLGLKPLTLTIVSVTDEQQPGWPYPTKRLKGTVSGVMAYVEQKGYDWHIVEKTKVEGQFDVYCSIQ